jgi:Transglycosylase SLT domain
MRKTVLIMSAVLLLGVSCDKSHMQQAKTAAMTGDQELDKEIRRVMEKGINLEERKAQVPAIAASFALRTDAKRARWLAALCYLKTLGTPFMPMDLAEIALAETGGHGLSASAVSKKGAVGVWQLMPKRAMSHGYSPEDMVNDEKCAEAAVRELSDKLIMARGNLVRAKKLYCGVGPEANAYEAKRRTFRREILDILSGGITPKTETASLKVAQTQ